MLPKQLDFRLAVSQATRNYHPEFLKVFDQKFSGKFIRTEYGEFPNRMPLYLVGSAERVLLLFWLNGDNFRETTAEIALAGEALTVNPDAAGANTKDLGVMFPFIDLRQHDRTRHPIPDSLGRAIAKAQGITNDALAKVIRFVAGAHYVVTVDMHNPWRSSEPFRQAGLDFINLATNKILADSLVKNGFVKRREEIVVASTDIGNLVSARDLAKKLGRVLGRKRLPLAINLKTRIGTEVDQQLVYGDIAGKVVVTADDMISSGGTTAETVETLKGAGAARIVFYATHPVFVGNYYENLSLLLADPNIKIVVSNSLPFMRDGRNIALPYARLDNRINKITVMDISHWLAEKTEVILKTPNLTQAKKALREEIIAPVNPYEVLSKITGRKISPPKDVAVYLEGGKVVPLPDLV